MRVATSTTCLVTDKLHSIIANQHEVEKLKSSLTNQMCNEAVDDTISIFVNEATGTYCSRQNNFAMAFC